MVGNYFYSYVIKWREIFSQPRAVEWQAGGWISNDYCADCRFCCGPQDNPTPFPMHLLANQLHPNMENDFFMSDATTAYLDQRGCKSITPVGCRQPRSLRPIACNIFPLVLMKYQQKIALYLYTFCPAVMFLPLNTWIDLSLHAIIWLKTLPETDIQQLAIDLKPNLLGEVYLSLHNEILTCA